MGTPWRLSARVCLSQLRGLGRAQERGLLGAPGHAGRARLCWLLLGALPALVSAKGSAGAGARDGRSAPTGRRAEDALPGRAPARLRRRVLLQPRVWLRAGALLARFLPLLLLLPLTYLAPGLAALWLRLLLKATEASGPTCIKLGQWASTRRDLFSEAFCAHFSRLHVRVAPHPWAHTERSLRQALGDNWGHVLFFETREPVGSGCVAQVYKAFASPALLEDSDARGPGEASGAGAVVALQELFGALGKERKLPGSLADQALLERLLLPTVDPGGSQTLGRAPGPYGLVPVAVKVLHPGLLSQVQVDLLLLKMGSRALGLLPGVQWLSLPEIVEEFEKLMTQQTDLRFEARNLEHFQRNFQDVTAVKFPTPLRPFVTRDVLVETYEESVPVSSYQQAGIPAELKRRIARLGINMLLKMIFVDNFVHADLHPGNILVQGTDGLSLGRESRLQQVDVCDPLVAAMAPALCPLRLVLLDAGIVAELQADDLRNFRAVLLAVALGQGHRVAELILHHARASECRDVEGFKAEMAALVTQARKNSVTLEKLHVSSLLSSVFRLLMTHRVKLESNFASIVFAIMVLEGLGRSLDPKLDILEAARPFLLSGPMARA
ncbi:putative aarF domain-containing protein kinase 2 [Erethizon dorsatum]